MANTGSGAIVHYAMLADKVIMANAPSAIAVASSADGGVNWPTLAQASSPACIDAYKPSIDTSADGQTVWVGYVCINASGSPSVHVARRVGTGWQDSFVTNISNVGALASNASPIVKRDLVNPLHVIVAWEDDNNQVRQIRMMQSVDGGATWGADALPVFPFLTTDPPLLGFNGNDARNKIHFWFTIDPKNGHCVIVRHQWQSLFYRIRGRQTWDPPLAHPIADSGSVKWFQPIIAGNLSYLAVSYYVEVNPLQPKRLVTWSKLSSDGGQTWTANSQPDQLSWPSVAPGGFVTDGWEPCVQVDPARGNYFGDYIGLSPLWAPWQPLNDQISRRFFTAWADSRPLGGGAACPTQNGSIAIHQHSVGELWGL